MSNEMSEELLDNLPSTDSSVVVLKTEDSNELSDAGGSTCGSNTLPRVLRSRTGRNRSSSSGGSSLAMETGKQKSPGAENGADGPPTAEHRKRRNSSRRTDSAVNESDTYCWICHRDGPVICCETCPRVFHLKCIPLNDMPPKDWVCAECVRVMHAENVDTRSDAMKQLSVEQLCLLLKFACNRMKMVGGAEPFCHPVNMTEFPRYREFVVHPMDLSVLERNIRKRLYGSTEAFLADAKWILHNCILFNSLQSKLTAVARSVLKVCRHEMSEIETCPDCYLHAHVKKESWFLEPCRRPHVLVWAKLKGFPFWPAKAMKTNREGSVDVRFFGAHDRAWVPSRDCFLYSREMPVAVKNRRKGNLDACIREVEAHIARLQERFGPYRYSPIRSQFLPNKITHHLRTMMPEYCPPENVARNSNSESVSTPPAKRLRTDSWESSIKAEVDAISTDAEKDVSDDVQEMHVPKVEKNDEEEERVQTAYELNDNNEDKVDLSQLKDDLSTEEHVEEEHTEEVIKEVDANNGGELGLLLESDNVTGEIVESESLGEVVSEHVIANEAHELENDNETTVAPADSLDSDSNVPVEKRDSDEENEEMEVEEDLKSTVTQEPVTEDKFETLATENKIQEAETSDTVKTTVESSSATSATTTSTSSSDSSSDDEEETADGKFLSLDIDLDPSITVTVIKPGKKDDGDIVKRRGSTGAVNSDKLGFLANLKLVRVASSASSVKQQAVEDEGQIADSPSEMARKTLQLSSDITLTLVDMKKPGETVVESASEVEEEVAGSSPAQAEKVPGFKVHLEEEEEEEESDAMVVSVDPLDIAAPASPSSDDGKNPVTDIAPSTRSPTPSSSSVASPDVTTTIGNAVTIAPVTIASRGSESVQGRARKSFQRSNAPSNSAKAKPMVMIPAFAALSQTPTSTTNAAIGAAARLPLLHPRPSATATVGSIGRKTVLVGSPLAAAHIHKHTQRISDFMQSSLEEIFSELTAAAAAASAGSSSNGDSATVKALQLEMERLQWRHHQELAEAKHNADLVLMEVRQSMEAEKRRAVNEVRRQCEEDCRRAVQEAKKKQWCAHCGKEALFYCCWNTSYCDYPCQQAHWPHHMATCAQQHTNNIHSGENEDNSSESPPATKAPRVRQQSHLLNGGGQGPVASVAYVPQSSKGNTSPMAALTRMASVGLPYAMLQPNPVQGGMSFSMNPMQSAQARMRVGAGPGPHLSLPPQHMLPARGPHPGFTRGPSYPNIVRQQTYLRRPMYDGIG